MDSTRYYDTNCAEYCAQTEDLDLTPLYAPFLTALAKPTATLLDAGCGSGRDTLYFVKQGYQVDACDGSAAMAAHASQRLNFPVAHLRFQDLAATDRYDGIWACASLLHVPVQHQENVAQKLRAALKPRGLLFASFKLRDGEHVEGERLFTGFTEATFPSSSWAEPFVIEKLWTTDDLRPGRENERWLNALLRKET